MANNDLTERLRHTAEGTMNWPLVGIDVLLREAADRIEGLEREVADDEAESDRHYEEDHAITEAIRKGSTEMMRWALGAEGYNRFWGPELERLGNLMDEIRDENARLRSAKEESEDGRL